MDSAKHALLLFCKPPVAGLVKTRLTEARGGSLSDQEAAAFYRCSLLDVAEVCMLALDDLDELSASARQKGQGKRPQQYDFFISTLSEEAVAHLSAVFEEDETLVRPLNFLVDRGASFDEHFDDAFAQIFARGYTSVVAVGGDMPLLPRAHVRDAFLWLGQLAGRHPKGYAFVQAPCQQSGVSLVGMTRGTPMDAGGVYYNRTGLAALDAYTNKLSTTNIPNVFLDPVSDVDNDNDLAHTISCLNAIAEASLYQPDLFLARRVLEWIDTVGLSVTAPPNDKHDPRQYIDTHAEASLQAS